MIFTGADAAALRGRLDWLNPTVFGIDCETVGIDPTCQAAATVGAGEIVCWSIAWLENGEVKGEVIWANQATWNVFGEWLRNKPVVGHNIYGFDSHMFRKAGYSLDNIVCDTLRLSRLINTHDDAEHSLKDLMRWWLGRAPVGEFRELFRRRRCLGEVAVDKHKWSWRTVDGEKIHTLIAGDHSKIGAGFETLDLRTIPTDHPALLPVLEDYAVLDAVAALELFFKMRVKDTATYDLYSSFWDRACAATAKMEAAGCKFDRDACHLALNKAKTDAAQLRQEWDAASGGVNPASPKQLAEFLYTYKRFPVPPISGSLKAVKRTKKDELPTSEAAIDWLQRNAQHPPNKAMLTALIKHQRVVKLVQFLEKLDGMVAPDGYLYAGFGPDTATGRLASRSPNLQNIPSNDPYGIRSCFVAPEGMKLLVSDFSALEPRILAHWLIEIFEDTSLAEALASDDLYGAVACKTWPAKLKGVAPGELKNHPNSDIRQLRNQAKIIVLSSNYGKTARSLAVQLGVADSVASQLLEDYFKAYPGIQQFQEWAYQQACTDGIRTYLGRTREIPQGKTEYDIAKSTRLATNTIIQGSAADIVYGAMVKSSHLETLQLQVHDELVWRIPEGSDPTPYLEAMIHPFSVDLRVPLKVDWHLVDNWRQAK